MLPVYALVQPLFEPAHEQLRPQPRAVRAAAYGLGFAAVEYASGRAFRRLLGRAPCKREIAWYNGGQHPDWSL